MSLTAGSQIGPYEILEPIGAGGMGEVSKARDTRLDRIVAIKISSERFSDRFEREARAIAALSHPNICTLFDVGSTPEGAGYLVMEYIEGETLADRIAQGPIPLAEALPVIRQITEALDAAHERGITHRDLKPANIKIKPDGSVKVLDFGLAKLTHPVDSGSMSGTPANSPTLTLGMTNAGMVLGTAAYMAPEQARGKTVDKRADIWSFGVVLYEMVTGSRLFAGEDVAHTLAAVIMQEPDYSAAAPELRPVLQRCLEKDPRKRLRDIGDVAGLIEMGARLVSLESRGPALPAPLAGANPRVGRIAIAAAGIFALAALGFAFVHFRETPAEQPPLRLQVPLPQQNVVAESISPDGRFLVVAGPAGLRLRSLSSPDFQMLNATSGASFPFWSPDSKSIGFFADSKLKRIDIAGGPALALADAPAGRGGTWSRDGTIPFTANRNSPILRISTAGGGVSPVTKVDAKENGHRFPWFLPDGRHFLYAGVLGSPDHVRLHVGDLGTGNVRDLGEADSDAIYAQGHLLFLREDTLMAQPFDPGRLAATGEAVPVEAQIQRRVTTAYANFSASVNGLLVFRNAASSTGGGRLTWVDRNGKQSTPLGEPANFVSFQLSPDGRKIAAVVRGSSSVDIWIYDAMTGGRTRFTFLPAAIYPVWSPDASRIIFGEAGSLYEKSADGAGSEKLLATITGAPDPNSWSRDGKFLLYTATSAAGAHLSVLPLPSENAGAPGKPFAFLPEITHSVERFGAFSPDGRWVAYRSDESGRNEIYVARFPGAAGKRQVSVGGGGVPLWRRDGKEIFYDALDNRLMAAPVSLKGDAIEIGEPRALPISVAETPDYHFDISPDGQRFLILPPTQSGPSEGITVVLNWQSLLKK